MRSSQEVVKGSELTLTCLVPDLGRPKALLYKWSLGDHIVNHVTTETWTINPVTLETQVFDRQYLIPKQTTADPKKNTCVNGEKSFGPLLLITFVHSYLFHCQQDDCYNRKEETWTIKLVTLKT